MGMYADQVLPRVLNLMMDTKVNREIRERVCADLEGEVVEIGFGSGLNLPHLPYTVTRLRVVDPSELGARIAAARVADSPIPVQRSGLDGARLPFEDDSADAVLCTWTLCTIPDAVAAVREVRRVLKPGGSLHFVEHGLSPEPKVARWQNRLNPLENRVFAGCNLNRDIPALIEVGGLHVDRLDTYYSEGDPKVVGWTFEGVAVPGS